MCTKNVYKEWGEQLATAFMKKFGQKCYTIGSTSVEETFRHSIKHLKAWQINEHTQLHGVWLGETNEQRLEAEYCRKVRAIIHYVDNTMRSMESTLKTERAEETILLTSTDNICEIEIAPLGIQITVSYKMYSTYSPTHNRYLTHKMKITGVTSKAFGFVECALCGSWIRADSALHYYDADDEKHILGCTDCLVQCECCGEIIKATHAFRTHYSTYICSSCYEESYGTCHDCGDVFILDDLHADNGEVYCPYCYEQHIVDDEDCDYNEDCADDDNELVKYYHYHKDCNWSYVTMTSFGKEANTGATGATEETGATQVASPKVLKLDSIIPRNAFKGYGAELEVDAESRLNNNQACRELNKIVGMNEYETNGVLMYEHDGSLDTGFEIITKPCEADTLLNGIPWKAICNKLLEMKYSSHNVGTCGLHIHISRANLHRTAIANIFLLFDFFWGDLYKASRRRDTGYCNRLSVIKDNDKYILEDTLDTSNITKEVQDAINDSFRFANELADITNSTVDCNNESFSWHYVCLNNQGNTTFEIRLGRGTLNHKSLMAWLKLILHIVSVAKRIPACSAEVYKADTWLQGLDVDTLQYLKSRNAFENVVDELLKEDNVTTEPNIDSVDNTDDSEDDE